MGPPFAAKLIRDLMTPKPVCLFPDATIGEALELMETRRFRHMPIIDQDRMLVGLISQRDILRLAWPTGNKSQAQRLTQSALVVDVMTRKVDTIDPDAPVHEAARYMLRTKRDSMPVVDETGHLIGIVTAADFLREVVRQSPSHGQPDGN